MNPPDGHDASKRLAERLEHRPRPAPAVLALMLPFSLAAAEPASPGKVDPGAAPAMSTRTTPTHGVAGMPSAVAASIDTLLGRVDDPEFGQAFFAIWLDPQTAAPELRSALPRDLALSIRPAAEPRQ